MDGWALIVAAVAVNLRNHKRGRPTICAVTRRTVPKPVLVVVYPAAAISLGVHVYRGYRAVTDALQEP